MMDSNGHDPDYAEQARGFLNQAYEELSRDDLRQASEKGWGAAAQIVQAVAVERGFDHTRHHLLYAVVGRLRDESRDESLIPQFGVANLLHTNFYEGGFSRDVVASSLEQVSQFVDRVQALLNGHAGSNGVN